MRARANDTCEPCLECGCCGHDDPDDHGCACACHLTSEDHARIHAKIRVFIETGHYPTDEELEAMA